MLDVRSTACSPNEFVHSNCDGFRYLSIVAQSYAGHAEHGGFLGNTDDLPLGIDQQIDHRRTLHEIGPSLCDRINRHEPHWMARWPSSKGNRGDDVMAYL